MSNPRSITFATGRFALARNLISNLGLILLSIALMMWFVPYLLRELGTERYGFIPIATNLVSFLSIATGSFSIAAAGAITIAINRSEWNEANQIFSATLCSSLVAGVILLLPATLFAFYPEIFLKVPKNILNEVTTLFTLSFCGLFLTTASIAFQIVSTSANRVDLTNAVTFIGRAARVILTVTLFYWISPTLYSAGAGIFVAALVELLGHIACWRRIGSHLTINLKNVGTTQIRAIATPSGWIMTAMIGGFLLYGFDVILVNHLLGPQATTDYAVAVQWAMLLRLFASSLSNALHPGLLRAYADPEFGNRLEYIQRSLKFIGYSTALGASILCGFSEPFIKLWLGIDFLHLGPLIILMIAPAAVIHTAIPMYSVSIAANRLRTPGYVTIAAGVTNVILSVIFAKIFDWGIYGIAVAGLTVTILKDAVFFPIYTASLLETKPYSLFSSLIKIAVISTLFYAATSITNYYLILDSWAKLATAGVFSVALLTPFVLFIGLNDHDRLQLKAWIFERKTP